MPPTVEEFQALLEKLALEPKQCKALLQYYKNPPFKRKPDPLEDYRNGLYKLLTTLLQSAPETAVIKAHILTLASLPFEISRPFCQTLIRFTDNQIITIASSLAQIDDFMLSKGLQSAATCTLNLGFAQLYNCTEPTLIQAAASRMNLLNISLNQLKSLSCYSNCLGEGTYCLEPVNSDPHMGGHRVVICFLRDHPNRRVAFKLRDMRPDAAVSDCIRAFNSFLPPHLHLPAPQIIPDSSYGAGYEAWVSPMETMVMEHAQRYYTQFGMLLFFVKLIGLTDLHQDNIFPTEDGPVVIDAECVLTPGVLQSKDLFDTQLTSALTDNMGDSGAANACFRIVTPDDHNTTVLSTSMVAANQFNEEILQGFDIAKKVCTTNWTLLKAKLMEAFLPVSAIRYVPLETSKFYLLALKKIANPAASLCDEEAFIELVKNLSAPLAITLDKEAAFTAVLETALTPALSIGDVPYFTLRLSPGKDFASLLCNGTFIGKMAGVLPVDAALEESLKFLSSPLAQAQLENYLLKPKV